MAEKYVPSDAQDIIDRYKLLLSGPGLYQEAKDAIKALDNAAEKLVSAAEFLFARGSTLTETGLLKNMPSDLIAQRDGEPEAIGAALLNDAQKYRDLAFVIDTCLDPNGKAKSNRKVPARLYSDATGELMLRYEQLTGEAFPAPQAAHQGEAQQPSTSFIADCLAKIDPLCTPAMAITCVRNVREERLAKNPEIRLGENPHFDPDEALRLLELDPVKYSAAPRS